MKRGKKLLSMLLVLVILVGATVAVTQLTGEDTAEEIIETAIFSLEPETVTAISWDYSEEVSFEKKNDSWVYAADDSFPLDESYIENMLDTLTEITSSKTIEAVEDWDQYTLEVPVCEIQVTSGENTHTLKIGEETTLGGQRYLSIGDGNAYLVDSEVLDNFSYGLYDLLVMESIPSMTDITSVQLKSDTQSYELEYLEDSGLSYSDDYVWFINGQALDSELTGELLNTIAGLTWQECAHFHVTDFAAYGLEEPAATVTVSYGEGETFVLSLGQTANGSCYARLGDSAMVYKVDADILDTLRYTTEEELQPDEVLLMNWEEVTSMDITLNGSTYQITKSTKTVTDDEGNTSEETVYELGGGEIDGAALESAIDGLTFTGYAAGLTPSRTEEIRILIRRDRETFPEVELAIYQYDSSQCLVTRDGEATVFVNRETLVDLVETANSLILG